MTKIEELEKIIQEQKNTIAHLENQIEELMTPYDGCWACATSEDGQMCYDCFYGPDHD